MIGSAALVVAIIGWLMARATPPPPPPSRADTAIRTWRGGETNACMVVVDGAALQEFADRYAVAMLCGVERTDSQRSTDRAVTVSRSFPIQATEFPIEEAISGPMRVLLAARAAAKRGDLPSRASALHEEALWYEVVLLPREVDAFEIRTLGDVERAGGRRLLSAPRRTTLAIRP